MPKRKPISSSLEIILKQYKGRAFTIQNIRDDYLNEVTDKTRSVKSIQHAIYKHLLALEADGQLYRLPEKSGRMDVYAWSSTDARKNANQPGDIPPQSNAQSPVASRHAQLADRLEQHKTELLKHIGESQEYESLAKAFPDMREELQRRYDFCRDRMSKLFGKIRAIEELIQEQ